MRILASIALALLLVGCSDSDDSTGPTGPPDAVGQYDGTWTIFGSSSPGGENDTVNCTGYVSIAGQSGTDISGELSVGPEGESEWLCSGNIARGVSGSIDEIGHVALRLDDEAELYTDCEGDFQLTGHLAGNRISLTQGPMMCDEGNNVITWQLSFTGDR